MLENELSCPKQLREVMIKQFFDFYDVYVETCTDNLNKDTQPMIDPFGDKRGFFEYSAILTRLKKLKLRFQQQNNTTNNHNTTSPKSSSASTNNKHPPMDPKLYTMLNGVESLDSNPAHDPNEDYGDIFNIEDDNDETSPFEDDSEEEQMDNDSSQKRHQIHRHQLN